MNPERQQALDYLRAPRNGLWRWAEDGSVIVWRDGSTIAFREEVVQIIEWLSPNGLPSFGAIVFLLAACRGKVAGVSEIVVESNAPLPAGMGNDAGLLLSARQQLKTQLEAALGQLSRLQQLPSELRSGVKARCVLAEVVFEPARAERHVEARAVLRGMPGLMNDAELTDLEEPSVSGSCIRQIHIVAEGLKAHTEQSLALRLRTGLDSLPQEIDENLPNAERARQLIEELSRDREFGAVARAARELMAAVRLPRRLGEREQLAIGGVADITNRGPLDRLLLSELAHDDLTLSVRVALNEALYLRREPPMREPPGTLALLLDSGVRLWGAPRVLATAVALALIARDKQHSEVLAWRAHGKQLHSVDLLSRHELTQHLGTLETVAHPGEALSAFSEAIEPGAQNQSVLITHRDVLEDPDFRRALSEHSEALGFVATVDREGHFELHGLPLARRPPLCEAVLDLATVFPEETAVPLIKTEIDPALPAIFGVRPFPFLLPLAGKIDCWVKGSDGFTYALLNDRRLVQFRDLRKGARELASDLPSGKTVWMDVVERTVYAVKMGASQRPARLLSFPLPDGPRRVTDLVMGPELLAVERDGEAILLIRSHDVRAYALSDGRLLGRVLNPLRWVHGRYFRGERDFHFALWDGETVRFEEVTLPTTILPANVVVIFDREGMDGPWLLLRNGEVVSTATDEKTKLFSIGKTLNFALARVSRNGHDVFVPYSLPREARKPVGCMLGLNQGRHTEMFQTVDRLGFRREGAPDLPKWNLFRVVEAFAKLPNCAAILGRKNRWRQINRFFGPNVSIRIGELPERGEELWGKIDFGPAKPTGRGCQLQTAEWPNGSKVFLDSRGLLHLKSHDPAVPEVSLVLSDGEVAGWTSDGYVCGPSFFFEEEIESEPQEVFNRVIRFLNRL
ncbi:MAG TPA: hypothetical protein VFZ59_08610 [Verrucomicrobiae bacterium]|nr:hypothetical protein [Verrucomicrobiae bacterium]